MPGSVKILKWSSQMTSFNMSLDSNDIQWRANSCSRVLEEISKIVSVKLHTQFADVDLNNSCRWYVCHRFTLISAMYRNMAQCGLPGKRPSTKAWTSSKRAPLRLCLTSMNQCVSVGNLIYPVFSKLLCFVVTPGHRTVRGSGRLLLGLPPCILIEFIILLIWLHFNFCFLNRIDQQTVIIRLDKLDSLPSTSSMLGFNPTKHWRVKWVFYFKVHVLWNLFILIIYCMEYCTVYSL